VLQLNSTLQELSLEVLQSGDDSIARVDWSPIFLFMGVNTGLKTLTLDGYGSMVESLCSAMQNGLGINATLEHLTFLQFRMCDDTADLCDGAFSFLRTNHALKSLKITLDQRVTPARVAAFRTDIAAMLQANESLESLSIQSYEEIEAEEYVALIVTALKHNVTLKTLDFVTHDDLTWGRGLQLTDDKDKEMAALLKKSYAMESLPDIIPKNEASDVGAILRLNQAGRRYLIEDGSSVSKGVELLGAVRSDINCVFLHLLENPRLCDRSAVEVASDGIVGERGVGESGKSQW
jgi:hypothetical protein